MTDVMAVAESRDLDPAERYFFLLDRLVPMNIVVTAELDRAFEPGDVRDAWGAVCRCHSLTRSRIMAGSGLDLFLELVPTMSPDFAVLRGQDGMAAIAAEHDGPIDAAGPLVRCRYLPEAGGGMLLVAGHHAVVDGRTLLWLLQSLTRALDGHGPEAGEPGLPPALHRCLPPERDWRNNRSAMLARVRALRDERAAETAVSAYAWHARGVKGRRTAVVAVDLDAAATARLAAGARAAGATFHGALAAAWLLAARDVSGVDEEQRLVLCTPADLRTRLAAPITAGTPGMYTTLLHTTHRVDGGRADDLACAVSAAVRGQVDGADGELFFFLARPEALAASEEGDRRMAGMIAGAPQCLAVSNTGVLLDTAHDPDWVRAMTCSLAPNANQVAFVTATTYRGSLTLRVALDHTKLADEDARALCAAARKWLTAWD